MCRVLSYFKKNNFFFCCHRYVSISGFVFYRYCEFFKRIKNLCVDSKNKIKSVLISETLINSYININNDKFVSVNAFRKYNDMKEDIKNTENAAEYTV